METKITIALASSAPQFLNLKECLDANGVIPENKIQIFTDHLSQLKEHAIKISRLT